MAGGLVMSDAKQHAPSASGGTTPAMLLSLLFALAQIVLVAGSFTHDGAPRENQWLIIYVWTFIPFGLAHLSAVRRDSSGEDTLLNRPRWAAWGGKVALGSLVFLYLSLYLRH